MGRAAQGFLRVRGCQGEAGEGSSSDMTRLCLLRGVEWAVRGPRWKQGDQSGHKLHTGSGR